MNDGESMIDKLVSVLKITQESGWPYVVFTTEEAAKLVAEIQQLKEPN